MNIKKEWEWATHRPLIQLMLQEYQPELVVELGVGINSTPLFLDYPYKELLCIDNNKEWVELMQDQYAFEGTASILFHDLGDDTIYMGTKVHEISDEQKVKNFEYYVALREQIKERVLYPKLLFVDNYTSLRALAINTLGHLFDIIIYHDCQYVGISWYNYKFQEYLQKDFNFLLLTSSSSWSGCFIRKTLDYDIEVLRDHIQPFVAEFCKENNIETSMRLLEDYYS